MDSEHFMLGVVLVFLLMFGAGLVWANLDKTVNVFRRQSLHDLEADSVKQSAWAAAGFGPGGAGTPMNEVEDMTEDETAIFMTPAEEEAAVAEEIALAAHVCRLF